MLGSWPRGTTPARRYRSRLRSKPLGTLVAMTLLACQGACPTDPPFAVELTIENGVYRGSCMYQLALTFEDSTSTHLCTADGENCLCEAGDRPGHYDIAIQDSNAFTLARLSADVAENDCGPVTDRQTWTGAPLDELPLPSCVRNADKLVSCGFVPDVEDDIECMAMGLRSREIDGKFPVEQFDCGYDCSAPLSCSKLRADSCAPKSEITDLEICRAECLGFEPEEIEEYGPLVGYDERCAELGGASGE